MRGFLKFLFSATIGVLYGMLFAQKPGKKLRDELKKSEDPAMLLIKELQGMAKDSGSEIKEFVKNSEELQKVMQSGKNQFEDFVKAAKNLGDDAKIKAKEQLEEVAKNAKKAAEDLKTKTKEKAGKVKESLDKKVQNITRNDKEEAEN
jgi:gas vesicle protein